MQMHSRNHFCCTIHATMEPSATAQSCLQPWQAQHLHSTMAWDRHCARPACVVWPDKQPTVSACRWCTVDSSVAALRLAFAPGFHADGATLSCPSLQQPAQVHTLAAGKHDRSRCTAQPGGKWCCLHALMLQIQHRRRMCLLLPCKLHQHCACADQMACKLAVKERVMLESFSCYAAFRT